MQHECQFRSVLVSIKEVRITVVLLHVATSYFGPLTIEATEDMTSQGELQSVNHWIRCTLMTHAKTTYLSRSGCPSHQNAANAFPYVMRTYLPTQIMGLR